MGVAERVLDVNQEASEIISELEQFLRERNIQLATSSYDSLQIWDLKPGEEPINSNGIEDRRESVEAKHDS